jgi:ferredoxin/protein involved in ribonucleotide reduction
LPMMLHAIYFSATHTTKKVITGIACKMAENMDGSLIVNYIDITLKEARKKALSFSPEDLVLVGVPVYAGRVPNILLNYLNSLTGNGALAIAVVVYGNRNYDDALIELRDILASRGLTVMAGAAFIGEHAFSETLAANRPDEQDKRIISSFAAQITDKLNTSDTFQTIEVKGHIPYREYYVPKNKDGEPIRDFHRIKPQTSAACLDCKLCAEFCPMGSIPADRVAEIKGICIKCCACVKKCPVQAKYFTHGDFLKHKHELETEFAPRQEPELFL